MGADVSRPDRAVLVAIEAYALPLSEGENKGGLICPFCASRDKSFSVKRQSGGVLYNCYRNSCKEANDSFGLWGTSGAFNSGAGGVRARVAAAKEPRPYMGDMRGMQDVELMLLNEAYQLRGSTVMNYVLGVDRESGRYIIPITGPRWERRGCIARTPPGSAFKPKSLTFLDDPKHPAQAWYHGVCAPSLGPVVVLVEDQWSAMRVSQDRPNLVAVALLGTHVSLAKAEDIRQVAPSRIKVCLDADATKTAFEIRKQCGMYWECPVDVVPLEKDIKDSTPDEVQLIL